MTPTKTITERGSTWCSNCGRHVCLIESSTPGVVVAVEFSQDRHYVATAERHVCVVRS